MAWTLHNGGVGCLDVRGRFQMKISKSKTHKNLNHQPTTSGYYLPTNHCPNCYSSSHNDLVQWLAAGCIYKTRFFRFLYNRVMFHFHDYWRKGKFPSHPKLPRAKNSRCLILSCQGTEIQSLGGRFKQNSSIHRILHEISQTIFLLGRFGK